MTDILFVRNAFGQTFPVAPEVGGIIDIWKDVELRIDKKETLSNFLKFSTKDESKTPFTLRLSQTIDPPTGLTLTPDVNGVTFYDEDLNGIVYEDADQLISATQPGDYTVTTTVTAVGTGQEFSKQTKVKVYAMDEPFVNLTMHTTKSLLPVNQASFLMNVSVGLWDIDQGLVTDVSVKVLETGQLFTLTEAPKQTPKDNRKFKGIATVDTSQSDRCFTYIAIANTPKGQVQSKNQGKVCITEFPMHLYSPPRATLWQSLTGTQYANNLIMISLKDDVPNPEHIIKNIATMINGRVIGQGSYGLYQIEVTNPPDLQDHFLDYYSDKLRGFPQIDTLQLYYKSAMILSVSDDPEFLAGNQHYLETVRADEAWYVAGNKSPTVAVVDTGVDIVHDDLLGKLSFPFNVVPSDKLLNDTDITDLNNHGSHVAGIIGAITNNSLGIAGISRSSQIIPIRAGLALRNPFNNRPDPVYWGDVVAGINVAVEREVKIINVSIGIPETLSQDGFDTCVEHFADRGPDACDVEKAKLDLCTAVAAAESRDLIVVAAAGNDGINMQMYPAVCDGAIAVGATDESGEARWIGSTKASNFG
jgi:hypothetical protein